MAETLAIAASVLTAIFSATLSIALAERYVALADSPK